MHQSTPITETLMAATYDQNARIGSLPFFKAVTTRQLAVDSYVALLNSMLTVYNGLGEAVPLAEQPVLQSVWEQHLQPKLALLSQDLAILANRPVQAIPAADLQGHVMAERLLLRGPRDPLSILGSLYVFATWNMGGAALCADLSRLMHLDGSHGVAFLASFDSWGQTHWQEFSAQLNQVQFDSEEHHQIVLAAQESLNAIELLIDMLHPINEKPTSELVMLLNPLAGNHKIPDDLREVQASMRAGERTWQYIPYYELRYGQRGRQFTWSDGGWLAGLVTESQDSYNQQVRWLSRLLSARGMPQWTMECSLMLLHEELVQALPEKRETYATIYGAALMLAEERRAHINDAELLALDQEFYAYVGPDWHAWLPNCGCLLASAVVDEKLGIGIAVEKIRSWMVDPARFPPTWIEAVQHTLEQARRQAR